MIKFYNVRGNETVEATTEPQIAAYLNSSDLNPNGIVQDFGWRLHPDTVKRLRKIQNDEDLIEKIADRAKIAPEDVSTSILLTYISAEDAKKERQEAEGKKVDYEREYEEKLRNLDKPAADKKAPEKKTPVNTRTTSGKKVATPAEIAAQKEKDEKKLEKMIADDAKKTDNEDSN